MTRDTTRRALGKLTLSGAIFAGTVGAALAAGLPLGISTVDTGNLPPTGDEWLTENPYRAEAAGEAVWLEALAVGESGYIQNCARCHGLEAISGGLAPDLRFLEAEEYGDEWYVERFRSGYTQNGTTKMPAFGELLGQDAAWAIRTYIETRPDEQAMEEVSDELKALRDEIEGYASDSAGADPDALKTRMSEIANGIETLSGAPVADSIAYRAAYMIDGTPEGYRLAADTLTIGLSAAN
ncbi:cytochrome c-550 PedF [Sulfitobacter sabulilitoris]|uniref:Cytochrome c-550 PedF n=1 Tax=Sulfitobacter sabulilitoris TaxID=2562655 RepID=A0A5S3Q3X1_9RHOB|nr:cytochrome c-550 PedF [Sulfitobacter sabulilitoris]TMM51221.1 cytochrome c-550 PedF [Sulfitobacter sabulilitoris]